MSKPSRLTLRSVLLLHILFLGNWVLADCECGYTANVNSSNITDPTTWLFTDVLESDFFHIDNFTLDTDWRAQNYSVTAEVSKGPFGLCISDFLVCSNSASASGFGAAIN